MFFLDLEQLFIRVLLSLCNTFADTNNVESGEDGLFTNDQGPFEEACYVFGMDTTLLLIFKTIYNEIWGKLKGWSREGIERQWSDMWVVLVGRGHTRNTYRGKLKAVAVSAAHS